MGWAGRDLESTATQYQTAITNLTTGSWLGPSSARMASAAAPYIAWMQSTAAEAAQTGAQAKAAAAAYQTAYASMVPPPLITANRTRAGHLGGQQLPGPEHRGDRAERGRVPGHVDPGRAGHGHLPDEFVLGQRRAARTERRTDGDQRCRSQCGSGRSAAAAPADSGTDPVLASAAPGFAELFGVQRRPTPAAPTLATIGSISWLRRCYAIAGNPTAALLPVQATYYMGMLGSTPARMFMSSGSTAGAGAERGHAGQHERPRCSTTSARWSTARALS